jgi:hypothetical protein
MREAGAYLDERAFHELLERLRIRKVGTEPPHPEVLCAAKPRRTHPAGFQNRFQIAAK